MRVCVRFLGEGGVLINFKREKARRGADYSFDFLVLFSFLFFYNGDSRRKAVEGVSYSMGSWKRMSVARVQRRKKSKRKREGVTFKDAR